MLWRAIITTINGRDCSLVNAPLGALRTARSLTCLSQLTLDSVGGKWKPLILWLLKGGRPRRFNDLQKAMPDVAHKVLIQQLRQLERDGPVSRTVVTEPHLQVEYSLTAFGTSLGPVLNEMAAWAKRQHRRLGATLGALK